MKTRPNPTARSLVAVAILGAMPVLALQFNFTTTGFPPGTAAAYLAAAQQAGNNWASNYTDPITVNVAIAYQTGMGTSVGNSAITGALYGYSAVTAALNTHKVTPDDISAVASLQASASAAFGINRGATGEVGAPGWRLDNGLGTPVNNQSVRVTNAGARALGLFAGGAADNDLTIQLNSAFVDGLNYDLNPNDGIGASQYDLVGVITHELGHGMGMESMAEILSVTGALLTEANMIPRLADLFRFSTRSITAQPKAFDLAADTVSKYFSVDGGTTSIAEFARGSSSTASGFGNGQEANHWLFGVPKIGIMDPVTSTGQRLFISYTDLRLFDVLGFTEVPEAGTWAGGIVLMAGGWWISRRWRRG